MKKMLKEIGKKAIFSGLFPIMYKWYSRKPVNEHMVLFIEIRYAELSNNFTLLYNEFRKREVFTVDTSFLGNSVFSYKDYLKACRHMIKKLAVAKYVFVNESSNVLAALPVRSETKLVQTWHGCGAFKKFGYEGVNRPKEKYYNDYYFTTVSSPEVIDIYAKSMGQNNERVLPIGVSRTDVFFDKQYVDACKMNIRMRYGIDEDKKVILYAPTFRGNVQEAKSPRLLDVKRLYNGLADNYVILYKGHPAVRQKPLIERKYERFFINASNDAIETLMCASDMCITDYSSLIFEYALLDKPMFFYAYDYREYVTERGFYYSFDEFVPGGIYYNEDEMINGIINYSQYSLDKIKSFKEKYMASCDGRATLRIIEKLLDDN